MLPGEELLEIYEESYRSSSEAQREQARRDGNLCKCNKCYVCWVRRITSGRGVKGPWEV